VLNLYIRTQICILSTTVGPKEGKNLHYMPCALQSRHMVIPWSSRHTLTATLFTKYLHGIIVAAHHHAISFFESMNMLDMSCQSFIFLTYFSYRSLKYYFSILHKNHYKCNPFNLTQIKSVKGQSFGICHNIYCVRSIVLIVQTLDSCQWKIVQHYRNKQKHLNFLDLNTLIEQSPQGH